MSYKKFKHIPLFIEWAPLSCEKSVENEKKLIEKKKEGGLENVVTRKKSNQKKKRDLNEIEMDGQSETRTKICVKNIPFESNSHQVRQLFDSFGKTRAVRIPRKMDGQIRGFAFVDFETSLEAVSAKEALGDTHFYGRKLVVLWAHTDQGDSKKKLKRRRMN